MLRGGDFHRKGVHKKKPSYQKHPKGGVQLNDVIQDSGMGESLGSHNQEVVGDRQKRNHLFRTQSKHAGGKEKLFDKRVEDLDKVKSTIDAEGV